jgi:hypothetical protein
MVSLRNWKQQDDGQKFPEVLHHQWYQNFWYIQEVSSGCINGVLYNLCPLCGTNSADLTWMKTRHRLVWSFWSLHDQQALKGLKRWCGESAWILLRRPVKWRSFQAWKVMWAGRRTWGSAFLEVQEFQGILVFIAITLTIADYDEWSWHGTRLGGCSKHAGSYQLLTLKCAKQLTWSFRHKASPGLKLLFCVTLTVLCSIL